jgi:hypothetical protein
MLRICSTVEPGSRGAYKMHVTLICRADLGHPQSGSSDPTTNAIGWIMYDELRRNGLRPLTVHMWLTIDLSIGKANHRYGGLSMRNHAHRLV